MENAKTKDEPVACSGKADCECDECGSLGAELQDTCHEFQPEPTSPLICICGCEEEDEIHDGKEFKDPALTEEDIAAQTPPPIANESTTGELTHIILQWQSKYHMLRKGTKEGSPVPLAQPAFLTAEGVTYMALSYLFSASGIYKVEKLK